MSSFKDLRIVDNFYQTSLFFPMPTVVISTLCEDGMTSLGPYSLVQPYYIADIAVTLKGMYPSISRSMSVENLLPILALRSSRSMMTELPPAPTIGGRASNA